MVRWIAGLSAITLLIGSLWAFGPREPFTPVVGAPVAFDEDLDAMLAASEAKAPRLTVGAEKEIVWADPATKAKTPLAVVYLHGFSATKEETRPLTDILADKLGANLFYARFEGHGADGDALAAARLNGWWRDTVEAIAIGRAIGDEVLIVGTSTGAALGTLALTHPELSGDVAGFIAISPNYRMRGAPAALLNGPFARSYLPYIAGEERSWTPLNEAQAKWWTTRYPIGALVPVGAAVQAVEAADLSRVTTPALFIFDERDEVVDHAATAEVAARWGGPAAVERVEAGPEDAPSRHVIAGRIVAPGMTDAVAEIASAWAERLK